MLNNDIRFTTITKKPKYKECYFNKQLYDRFIDVLKAKYNCTSIKDLETLDMKQPFQEMEILNQKGKDLSDIKKDILDMIVKYEKEYLKTPKNIIKIESGNKDKLVLSNNTEPREKAPSKKDKPKKVFTHVRILKYNNSHVNIDKAFLTKCHDISLNSSVIRQILESLFINDIETYNKVKEIYFREYV